MLMVIKEYSTDRLTRTSKLKLQAVTAVTQQEKGHHFYDLVFINIHFFVVFWSLFRVEDVENTKFRIFLRQNQTAD